MIKCCVPWRWSRERVSCLANLDEGHIQCNATPVALLLHFFSFCPKLTKPSLVPCQSCHKDSLPLFSYYNGNSFHLANTRRCIDVFGNAVHTCERVKYLQFRKQIKRTLWLQPGRPRLVSAPLFASCSPLQHLYVGYTYCLAPV